MSLWSAGSGEEQLVMAAPCDIRDHHVRCEPHLARLQMMARYEANEPLPPGLADEVVESTSAVLAEAQAAGRVMVAALATSQRRAVTAFLDARLRRLAAAAGEVAAAVRGGDVAALRRHLRKFEVLTSALWTVQLELSAETAPSPSRRNTARVLVAP
jgi:hypothetical protein